METEIIVWYFCDNKRYTKIMDFVRDHRNMKDVQNATAEFIYKVTADLRDDDDRYSDREVLQAIAEDFIDDYDFMNEE